MCNMAVELGARLGEGTWRKIASHTQKPAWNKPLEHSPSVSGHPSSSYISGLLDLISGHTAIVSVLQRLILSYMSSENKSKASSNAAGRGRTVG